WGLTGRRPLDEGAGAVEHAVPGLAEQPPEGGAIARERRAHRAFAIRQPHVPGLAELADERGADVPGVRGLHVVLPLQEARAVGPDAGAATRRLVVGAAHAARLAAGHGRVAVARPFGIAAGGPRRRALIARAIVEIGHPPRPEVGRGPEITRLPPL